MNKLVLLLVAVLLYCSPLYAQVGIGTSSPDSSSLLDVSSSSKGLLVPRMTKTEREGIIKPATGLLIYQTTYKRGFYFNSGNQEDPDWRMLEDEDHHWTLSGNEGTTPGEDFIGTLDDNPLIFRIRNQNSGIIDSALHLTSFGYRAIKSSSQNDNTAFGYKALSPVSTGNSNTSIGSMALQSNISGNNNTAIGKDALRNCTSGDNTSVGESSMFSASSATQNVAVGNSALRMCTTSAGNTAVGYQALYNTAASQNTGVGGWTLYTNGTGRFNSSLGYYALFSNSTGWYNTGLGHSALYTNSTGGENTAIGYYALRLNSTGSKNTALGKDAFSTGDAYNNSTAIGYNAQVNASNQVRLGDDNIESLICKGAYYTTTTNRPNLYINSDGTFSRYNGTYFNLGPSSTPTGTADASGNVGDITWDDNYVYIKTSAGWKRSALTAW